MCSYSVPVTHSGLGRTGEESVLHCVEGALQTSRAFSPFVY